MSAGSASNGGTRVVLTGAGVISAIGAGLDDFANALFSGTSAISNGPPMTAAIADFTPQTWLGNKGFKYIDRAARLLCVAAYMAIEKSGWTADAAGGDDSKLGLIYGTMFGSAHSITSFDWTGITEGPSMVSPLEFPNTVISSPGGQAAIKYHLLGANWTVCQGFASSLHALQQAATFLRLGRAKALLAGGAEEASTEAAHALGHLGLLANGTLPVPFGVSTGVVPGEGAALWMLETEASAKARGAPFAIEILGFGQAQSDTLTAESAASAMRGALRNSKIEAGQVGCIIASADGAPALDGAELGALREVFGEALTRIPVCAPKAALGETMGAAGIFAATAGALALHRQAVPPTVGAGGSHSVRLMPEAQPFQGEYALVNAFSYDGNAMSMVLGVCRS